MGFLLFLFVDCWGEWNMEECRKDYMIRFRMKFCLGLLRRRGLLNNDYVTGWEIDGGKNDKVHIVRKNWCPDSFQSLQCILLSSGQLSFPSYIYSLSPGQCLLQAESDLWMFCELKLKHCCLGRSPDLIAGLPMSSLFFGPLMCHHWCSFHSTQQSALNT